MGLEKSNWIAGIISAIVAIVVLFYTLYPEKELSKQPFIAQTSGEASTQIGTVGGNVTIVNQNPSISTKARKLPQVFKQDTIGSTVSYIENIIGPAKSIWKYNTIIYRDYIVDGCMLSLLTEKDGSISGMKLDISDTCTFDWKDVMHNYSDLPQPHLLRFGDVMKNVWNWTFIPGCLSSCGNAADPESEIRFGASRADGWLMAILTAVHDSGDNLNAAFALRDKLERKMGKDFVLFGEYQCNFDINSEAVGIIDNMRVDSVTIRPHVTGAVPGIGDPEIGENVRCK